MENQRPDGQKVAQSPFFKILMEKAEKYLKHPKQVTELLNDAFKKGTAQKGIGALAGEVWENLQLLSRMIKAAVGGEYHGIPSSTLVGGIAVIIYFLSPIDLIPDFIPVIGLLDDASLLAWFIASIKSELDKFKEWEATRPAATEAAPAPATDSVHHADSSFGTPKFSDQPAGNLDVHTGKDL